SDATLLQWLGSRNLLAALQVLTVIVKIAVFMLIFVWVRWTIPRFRFDQLMRLAWKNLIPLGLFNLVLTALILYFKGAA
ncbi:NADH-quinone oxidoreductase subunit H, partial [bacterium]|nr:NADH-quinone oxidoreductase subunit H [bacterium]